MTYSDWELRLIARGAALPDFSQRDPHNQRERLVSGSSVERWVQTAGRGEVELLYRRFEREEILYRDTPEGLCLLAIDPGDDLPPWTATLQEALDRFCQTRPPEPDIHPGSAIRFQELYRPFVTTALERLFARAVRTCARLSEEAVRSLTASLYQRLSHISRTTLDLEFSLFRATRTPWIKGKRAGSCEDSHEHAFVRYMQAGGLRELFLAYPVLARLLCTTIDSWADAYAELFGRFEEDWRECHQAFGTSATASCADYRIIDLLPELSDPHHGNRTVVAMFLESGLRIVYKPRDLDIEAAFNALVDWLNDKLRERNVCLPALRCPRILPRMHYGWVEYVEPSRLGEDDLDEPFFQRAGMLVCLCYVLGVTDLHFENVIYHEKHALLIDLETLLHADVSRLARWTEDDIETDSARIAAHELLADSVLRSGLLPQWSVNAHDGNVVDVSGFAAGEVPADPRLERNHSTSDSLSNSRPIVDGFSRLYKMLMEVRGELLCHESPLECFDRKRVRFIFRSTHVYGSVLQRALQPRALRNGLDWLIELDTLSRAIVRSNPRLDLWPIFRAEIRALDQLDIPLFSTTSDRDVFTLPTSAPPEIHGLLEKPSYLALLERVRCLNEADLSRQVSLVQASLYAKANDAFHRPSASKHCGTPDCAAIEPLPYHSDVVVQMAVTLGEHLKEFAVHGSDGSATWIGLTASPDRRMLQTRPVDHHLYDGYAGISVFLGALERIVGTGEFGRLALDAMRPLRSLGPERLNEYCGGAFGTGSVLYSAVKLCDLLGAFPRWASECEDLLLNVETLASCVPRTKTLGTGRLDVLVGSAGAILGFLALHRAMAERGQSSVALEHAAYYGDQLLKPEGAGWKAPGLAHGSSGMGYALSRLHVETGDCRYLEAAQAMFRAEREEVQPYEKDPRDLAARFGFSWCNGIAGIGLANLGSLGVITPAGPQQALEYMIQAVVDREHLAEVDHVCCGNLGCIEFLLQAAKIMERPELLLSAKDQLARIVARAAGRGAFAILPNKDISPLTPGFFQGTAGIGYMLLRTVHPEVLPSVLMWE